jgi:hypothetical protein
MHAIWRRWKCGAVFLVVFHQIFFHLPALLHLTVPSYQYEFPDGIGNAKSLCTLKYFDLMENSLENIHGLGELTNPRNLKICCFPNSLLGTVFISCKTWWLQPEMFIRSAIS